MERLCIRCALIHRIPKAHAFHFASTVVSTVKCVYVFPCAPPLHPLLDVLDHGGKLRVAGHELVDLVAGAHGRRMVVAVKQVGNALVGQAEHAVTQIHRDLPRHDHLAVAPLGIHALDRNGIKLRHGLLDELRRDLALFHLGEQILERVGRDLEVQRAAAQARIGHHARQTALELTNVALHMIRDEREHRIVNVDIVLPRAVAQDRDARFDVRRLNIGNQSPLEARAEALLQLGDLLGRPVGADDDLLVRIVQRVEGVEKLLLRGLTAADKLYVVDHQNIHVPVALAEFQPLVLLNRGDQLVCEGFAGHIHHARAGALFLDKVADRVHEVRFAETDAAVDEQRVIGGAGVLRDGLRRSVRKLVGTADDKAVERVFRVQRIHVDRLGVLVDDILIAILRQHKQHVRNGVLRLARSLKEHLKVEILERLQNIRVWYFQNEDIVLIYKRNERIDPGMKTEPGHLRTNLLPRARPDF